MPYLGKRSLLNTSECSWQIQKLIQEMIKAVDFTVICGGREKDEQNAAYDKGNSKLKYPQSKHNKTPSEAFDFIPCPFNGWGDKESFEAVAKVAKIVAYHQGIEIACGIDWGWDSGHIEIK